MRLSPRDRLGPYEVLGLLGSGGMGEVYKARDTRLARAVAIKVLSSQKVSDPARRRRFLNEAKAASALNHPNIVAVYDIATDDGIDFIVMEYVTGQSLDQVIPRGGLRASEGLKYAIQIADALARAHSAGIVHRDLKPANIMVTAEGQVKLLDFGLAKLTEPPFGAGDDTLTLLSRDGAIMGTIAYMSPEQAEGRTVDHRSDIFTLGSVLYEMLTGQKPFSGKSQLITLNAVLSREPRPIEELAPDIPRDLAKIVLRCLRKDPARRFQHMEDLKVALQEVEEKPDSGASPRPLPAGKSAVRRREVYAAAATSLVLLVLAGWWVFGRSRLPPPKITPFTSFGSEWDPAFSPDGNLVAFAWAGPERGNYDIYVQQIGAGSPLRLTTDAAIDRSPVFSPDGKYIAFTRGALTLMLVPALGGQERKIATVRSASIDFSPDGQTIAISDSESAGQSLGIFLVSVETGAKRRLTTSPSGLDDLQPRFSPNGQTVAFQRAFGTNGGDLRVVSVSGGAASTLLASVRNLEGLSWMPDGREIVFSGRRESQPSLWRISVSGGQVRPLSVSGENATWPVVARNGRRAAYIRRVYAPHIWRLDLATGSVTQLIASTWQDRNPQFSPDGTRIAWVSDRSGTTAIWVAKASGADSVRLTSIEAALPRWSPDGRRIAFTGLPHDGHNLDIFVVNTEGGAPMRITTNPGTDDFPCWSADGSSIYFRSARTGRNEIWRVPSGGGQEQQMTRQGGDVPQISTDGSTLYYWKRRQIWKVPAQGGPESLVMEADMAPVLNTWQAFDDGVYFVERVSLRERTEDRILFFDFASRKLTALAKLEKPAVSGLSVLPDRRQVIFSQVDRDEHDIMLIENLP